MQNVEAQLHYLLAIGRIDVGSGQNAVGHTVYAATLSRHTVYAQKAYLPRHAHLLGCLAGIQGGQVAVAENNVGCRMRPQIIQHGVISLFRRPVGVYIAIVHMPVALHHRHKATVPVYGRRRQLAARNLQYMPLLPLQLLTQQAEGIVGHGTPGGYVVATYIGGVAIGVHLAVEKHHRYALLAGTLYGWSKRLVVVGSNNQDVYTRGNEAVYLIYLTARIIVGIGNVYSHHIII